jgi:hypothetical protein
LEDGKSVREHYITAWKTTGNRPHQLDQPILSSLVNHIWGWFIELHRARGITCSGPAPISYRDITDWSRLQDIALKKWEITALCLIDKIYISESQKTSE